MGIERDLRLWTTFDWKAHLSVVPDFCSTWSVDSVCLHVGSGKNCQQDDGAQHREAL